MSKLSKFNAYISAVGYWMPDKVITNNHFASYLDTSDEWIKARTGISERRFLEDNQPTSYAAIKAIEATLKNRGITAEELDLIVVATVTPDMIYPSTACVIQEKIGAKNCWGFDILAACSGFIFSLITASQFIESGKHK